MKPTPLLQILPTDSAAVQEASSFVESATAPLSLHKTFDIESVAGEWLTAITNFGIRIVLAIVLFFVGKFLIGKIIQLIRHVLERKKMEGVAITLLDSIIAALLYIVLGICIAAMLGVKSVSFAAVLASMGLAVGMALSGQLQNLAGGVIIMVTKPFHIGDPIEAQTQSGVVRSVSLFHTKITTFDNKTVYIPNGTLSSGVITNIAEANTRRAEWIIGIDYESDYDRARQIIQDLLLADERVLTDPSTLVALHRFGPSSIDIIVHAWVSSDNLWALYWDMNERILHAFNAAGISFPFPQVTISHRKTEH